MSYCISVDVGTSYTAAAIVRNGEAPQVFSLGLRAASIPSVIFLGADGASVVGEAAERRGLLQPERLAREFKRRVGDSVPYILGERSVLAEDLYALVVRHVVDLAEEREGEAPTSITLTHPAEWGGHKLASVRAAVAGVGITEITLITEPEAAALSYASAQRVPPGSVLAVYDLGGGTFDATVLRKSDSDSFAVLGSPSGLERLGGADFDQAVFAHVVESLPEVFAGLDPTTPETLQALARLRRECVEAKEALSTDADTTIAVFLPGVHEQVRLVRSEFETMIEQDLRRTLDVLEAALAEAEVEPQHLSAILLIGGSSRIPLVAQLLSDEFERPLAVDADPKASIALGAAFAMAALTEEPAVAGNEPTVTDPETVAANAFVPVGVHSLAPRHGPEAMSTNRRLGMRISVLVGAVALIGVATASAAGTTSPLAVLSSLAGGSVQDAEAAEPADAAGEATQNGSDGAKGSSSTDVPGDDSTGAATDAGAVGAGPLKPDGAGSAFLFSEDPADRNESTSSPRPDTSKASTSSPEASAEDTSGASSPTQAAPGAAGTGSPRPGAPAPTTPAPTTQAPGTPARIPTTPSPTTPAPTTPASEVPVPTTPAPAPTTPAPVPPPTTPAPTTPAQSTPAPTTPAQSTPAPTTPAPTTPASEAPAPTTPAVAPDPGTSAPVAGNDPSGSPSEEPSSASTIGQGGTDAPSAG